MDAEGVRRLLDLEQRLNRLETLEVPGAAKAWIPRFSATTGPGAYTYVTQTGWYTRIGPWCLFAGHVWISAIGSAPVGNMVIDGLPFAAVGNGGCAFGDIWNFNYTNTAFQLVGQILNGEAFIRLVETFDNANSAGAPAANFTNANCSFVVSGVYRIA